MSALTDFLRTPTDDAPAEPKLSKGERLIKFLRDSAPGDEEQRAAWMRSIARAPATLAGGPVDLVNAAIGGLNALGGGKSPIKATEKPVGGSQWLAEHLGMPEEPGSPYADTAVGLVGGPVAGAAGRAAGAVEEAIASARPSPVAGGAAAQRGAIGAPKGPPRPAAVAGEGQVATEPAAAPVEAPAAPARRRGGKVAAVAPSSATDSLLYLPKTADPYVARVEGRLPNKLPGRGGEGALSERMTDLLDNPAAGRAIRTAMLRGEEIDPNLRFFYGANPFAELASGEGLTADEFGRMMQHYAAASQRNPVAQQNRMGSHMWSLDRRGLLLPENREQALSEGALKMKTDKRTGEQYPAIAWPEGYGSLAQGNISNAALKIGEGEYPFDDMYKLGRFYKSYMGHHPGNAVVDVMGVRVPAMASRDPRWLVNKAIVKEGGVERVVNPQEMHASGELSMDEALKRPGFWEAAPSANEYKPMEDLWLNAGKKVGAPGGEGQALGWYGSARLDNDAGLKTPPMTWPESLEASARQGAERSGLTPMEILKRVVRGERGFY